MRENSDLNETRMWVIALGGFAILIGVIGLFVWLADNEDPSVIESYRTEQARTPASMRTAARVPASTPTRTLARSVDLEVETCTNRAVAGTVTNHSAETLDIFVTATFEDEAGVQIGDSIDAISSLAPGKTARFNAPFVDDGDVETCRARVDSVFRSR